MRDQPFSKVPLNKFGPWRKKITPKQVLAQILGNVRRVILKYETLNTTQEQYFTKLVPLFLKNGVFAALNASRESLVVLKKTPPFTRFFGRACVRSQYLTDPPGTLNPVV